MRYSIYQLVDPRDNSPRYVGYTSQANIRMEQHLAGDNSNLLKRAWIAELRQLGLSPIMEEIEAVEGTATDAVNCESRWIHRLFSEGKPLTNSVPLLEEKQRQTVYLPQSLAIRLKVHAAAIQDDISGIITRLVEQYLDEVERGQK